VAVGLAEVVAHPGDRLAPAVAALLVGGCAAYLATFGYTRWRMFRAVSWTRLSAAGICLALLPAASRMPAVVALVLLVVVVAGLNVVEAMVVRRGVARADKPQAPQVAAGGPELTQE